MKNSKWSKIGIGIAGALLGAGVVLAQDAGLHIFSPGQVISSTEVNENFAVLEQRIETNAQLTAQLSGLNAQQITQLFQLLEILGPEQITQIINILNQNDTSISQINSNLQVVNQNITQLQQQIIQVQQQTTIVETRVTEVELKTQFMSVEGQTTLFTGTNVQLVSGAGLTETVNGLGNLIVGYNESDCYLETYGEDPVRNGSHCLIVGSNNAYSGAGSSVLGHLSGVDGDFSTVIGCGRHLVGDCRFRSSRESRHKNCHEGNSEDPEDEDEGDE